MKYRYSKLLPEFIFINDLLLLNVALIIGHYLEVKFILPKIQTTNFFLIVNLCWITVSSITRVYIFKRPLQLKENLNNFSVTILYHLGMVLGILFVYKIFEVKKLEIILTYLIFFTAVILQRAILFYLINILKKQGFNKKNILIIGKISIFERLEKAFSKHPEYAFNQTESITDDMIKRLSERELLEMILSRKPNEIFICHETLPKQLLQQIVNLGDQNLITIKLVSDLALSNNYAEVINYENLPVIQLSSNSTLTIEVIILKRMFDVLFSSCVMIIGFPVFILLILITRLTSRGPVFFAQQRLGKDQKPFTLYKFRSMYINSELKGPQLSTDRDPRITSWGRVLRKSRLDELPQFFNVLKGEMSVVGPRPERQFFIDQLLVKSPNYKKLLSLKPGLTSLGQVNYGYAENIEEMCNRIRYDLVYLNNRTIVSDIGIIFKTVKVMAQFKGK